MNGLSAKRSLDEIQIAFVWTLLPPHSQSDLWHSLNFTIQSELFDFLKLEQDGDL